MFFHLDNFAAYDTVRATGAMNLSWLSTVYQVNQSVTTNLRIGNFAGRVGLGTGAVTSGTRSVYAPLGRYLANSANINITQKLLGYQPNGTAIGGLSIVDSSTDSHILSFGFTDQRNGFVTYVDSNGIVQRDTFILPTRLSGIQDLIEWGFEKSVQNDASEYRPFILWVNNKPAYTQQVFSQIGSSSNLAARISGGVSTLAAGTASPSGFVGTAVATNIPICATTDLIINSGTRNGLVRVLSRVPAGDVAPNTMTPSVTVGSHSEITGRQIPDASRFLTASTAAEQEMFGAQAFQGLSSEAILAFALQVVGSKDNPFAPDFEALIRSAGQTYAVGDISLDMQPVFGTAIVELNPATGLPFTALEANSYSFGVKVA